MVDALSDVLRVVRLDGAYFYAVQAAEPWSMEAVAASDLTPQILPDAEHLIPYHILTQGRCWATLPGEQPMELRAGDVIVFPHGDPHLMSSAPGRRVAGDAGVAQARRYPETLHLGDGGPATATFVCGFLGCDRRPFNPLLAALPRRLHVRGLGHGWLDTFARQVVDESRSERAGADCVLTRLAELMFIEVLRHYLQSMDPAQTGWLAGLRDPVVGRALSCLHARPEHPWSLSELAEQVAASRSSLAERFTHLVGQPPMQYLAQWRMQIAAGLLAQSGEKVAAIAVRVGYDSEAAFSRAFKKATGQSPGAWRDESRGSRRSQAVARVSDGTAGSSP